MSQKKETLRKCIVTKEQFPKAELLRIVKSKDGRIFVDETGKAQGRGAYIRQEGLDLQTLKKSGALQRSFRTKISDEVFEEIAEFLSDG